MDVEVFEDDKLVNSTRTDADGKYSLNLLSEKEYDVVFKDEGDIISSQILDTKGNKKGEVNKMDVDLRFLC